MAMRQDDTVGLGDGCLLVRRDGEESAIEDTAAPIHDSGGQVTGAVIVFHGVGAARAMSDRMSHLAQHDPLTGLPNRLLLHDRLSRAIASARRRASALAVLFLDVDRFKRVNDSLGHAAGDQLLKSIADRLTVRVRDSDTVCRYGGDEFVVLLPEVACGEDADFSADQLLAAIAMPHRVGDRTCTSRPASGFPFILPTERMLRRCCGRRTLPCFARSPTEALRLAGFARQDSSLRYGALPHRPACPDTRVQTQTSTEERAMKIRTVIAAAAISMTLFTVAGTAITVGGA